MCSLGFADGDLHHVDGVAEHVGGSAEGLPMQSDIHIDPDNVVNEFEERHRDAMLDLILAWGSLDGALGMLLSRILGISLAEGAELIGKLRGSAKLTEIGKILQEAPGGTEAARKIKRYKRKYEKHSYVRNRIAHSHCAGIWRKDRNYIVFAAYEKAGDDALAVDAIPIEEMHRATDWGRALTALAVKLAGASQNET